MCAPCSCLTRLKWSVACGATILEMVPVAAGPVASRIGLGARCSRDQLGDRCLSTSSIARRMLLLPRPDLEDLASPVRSKMASTAALTKSAPAAALSGAVCFARRISGPTPSARRMLRCLLLFSMGLAVVPLIRQFDAV